VHYCTWAQFSLHHNPGQEAERSLTVTETSLDFSLPVQPERKFTVWSNQLEIPGEIVKSFRSLLSSSKTLHLLQPLVSSGPGGDRVSREVMLGQSSDQGAGGTATQPQRELLVW